MNNNIFDPVPEAGIDYNLQVTSREDGWHISLTIINKGTQPQDLCFRSAQEADFEIESDGKLIWVWSAGRMFTQAIINCVVPVNGVLGPFTATWDGRDFSGRLVEAGELTVRAYFLATGPREPVAERILSISGS